MKKRLCILLAINLALAIPARTQVNQTSAVLDGSGGLSSGGVYQNISAAGQPGGIAYSTAGGIGGLQNYAGFLGTFILRPDLVDPDGVPWELSQDNDGDGLTDIGEILGTYFDPNTPTDPNNPDTSGDGHSDWEHFVAGTDPTGSDTFPRILDITREGDEVTLTWLSRAGKNYNIRYADDLQGFPTNFLAAAVGAAPGTGPWMVSTNNLSATVPDPRAFFAIEVLP